MSDKKSSYLVITAHAIPLSNRADDLDPGERTRLHEVGESEPVSVEEASVVESSLDLDVRLDNVESDYTRAKRQPMWIRNAFSLHPSILRRENTGSYLKRKVG
jgi:hypothetical protein